MFGIELTRSEWAALVGVVFLLLRILFAVGRVVWWYATDSQRTPKHRPALPIVTGVAADQRLVGLGQAVRPAYPELLVVMRRDDSADVRAAAGEAILYSLVDPPEDDPEIPKEARGVLADPDLRVRTVAAALLLTFKAAPPADLLPVFCDGLLSEDENIRSVAATGLEK